jgi:hypothetical protein
VQRERDIGDAQMQVPDGLVETALDRVEEVVESGDDVVLQMACA